MSAQDMPRATSTGESGPPPTTGVPRPKSPRREASEHGVLLRAQDLARSFGSFRAVDGVSLQVAQGSIHSVIGPNGAGKTTLFRLLTGILRPTAGRLLLAGEDVTGKPPHAIARRGLAQSFQMTTIFPRLTALESVQAAIVARSRRSGDIASWFHRSTVPEARQLLERVGLAGRAQVQARALSHGDQRALDVALALATRPRVLLLDEPTAGMSAAETEQTISLITGLVRAEALTVLFSEHDMDVVFGISDQISVLHQGRIIAEGTGSQIRANDQVRAVYLGGPDTGSED